MGWIKDSKARMITTHAQRAIEEGHVVFLARINVGMTDGGYSGPVTGAAEQIEAVEALGWKLDHMSYARDRRGRPEGYFLFRRAAQHVLPQQQAYPQQQQAYPPQQPGYPPQQPGNGQLYGGR